MTAIQDNIICNIAISACAGGGIDEEATILLHNMAVLRTNKDTIMFNAASSARKKGESAGKETALLIF